MSIPGAVGGVVKEITKVPVTVGGVVKEAASGVCGVGGVVRTFYQNELVLYDNGTNKAGLQAYNEYGYQDSNYTSFNSDHIYITYSGSNSSGFVGYTVFEPSKTLSLSGFTKMYIEVTVSKYYSGYTKMWLYINDKSCEENPDISLNSRTIYEFTIPDTVIGATLASFEISGYNTSKSYVGPCLTAKIHKIWFE